MLETCRSQVPFLAKGRIVLWTQQLPLQGSAGQYKTRCQRTITTGFSPGLCDPYQGTAFRETPRSVLVRSPVPVSQASSGGLPAAPVLWQSEDGGLWGKGGARCGVGAHDVPLQSAVTSLHTSGFTSCNSEAFLRGFFFFFWKSDTLSLLKYAFQYFSGKTRVSVFLGMLEAFSHHGSTSWTYLLHTNPKSSSSAF